MLAGSLGDNLLTHPAPHGPLATGLGNEHPLENGFAFLTPHGLPYLAGSGVKGVLRRAAEELVKGEWGDACGWDKTGIDILFGLETEPGDTQATHTRGALSFWDLFFQPPGDKAPLLAVEIMTPHHSQYLQHDGSPHANEQPTPIPFLAVAAGSHCTLYVQCNPALIPADHAELRDRLRALIEAAIDLAGEWLGFGAKTAVGYGAWKSTPGASTKRGRARKRGSASSAKPRQPSRSSPPTSSCSTGSRSA
jgi:CRISPR-associated protein Cmr6